MAYKLKELLQEYRKALTSEEKNDVLYHVYDYETVVEINEKGYKNNIYRLKFKLDSVKKAHNHAKNVFAKFDSKDIDQYVLQAVYEIFEKAKIDFNKSDREIEIWFIKNLVGRVKNEITADYEKQKLNVVNRAIDNSEKGLDYSNDDSSDRSLYDKVALRQYKEGEIQSSFDGFIESVGGFNSILSKQQQEVFNSIKSGKTQTQIAEDIGCSQQNIQKLYSSAKKRIAKSYIDYKLVHIQTKAQDTLTTIENYIHTYNNILQFDTTDTFDYFGYTYKFLKDNYKLYNIHNDKSYTVFDVIFDYLKKNEHELFNNIEDSFSNSKLKLTKRQKDRVVIIINRIFRKYIDDIYKATQYITKTVIENTKSTKSKIGDYDNFIKGIS